MLKIIFLDIDGVLNNESTQAVTPSGYVGVDNSKVKLLKRIVDKTGAQIVLSSDWRLDPDSLEYRYLRQKLKYKGRLSIFDHTPNINWERRGLEISKWLESHQVDSFVILDDIEFQDFLKIPDIKNHFIHTDYYHGLTDEDVEKAISILNKKE